MKVIFDRSFSKSINKIASAAIKKKIESIIIIVESAKSIYDIPNLKKMEGYKTFYRIRMGEYRIGVELMDANAFRFIIVAHQKDIYRIFP